MTVYKPTYKFSTGIETVDSRIGGMYPGSTILLEMVGAGGREFAINSLIKNCEADFPSELHYVSITDTPDEVIRNIQLTFPEADQDLLERLFNRLKITSLAGVYFRKSIVPMRWVVERKLSIDELKGEADIMVQLAETVEGCEDGSLIFLDSLSDLVRLIGRRIEWADLVDLMKGFKKLCIKKNMLLLSLLTSGILNAGREDELLDQADAVFVFEWQIEKEAMSRWMYFRKFLGVLPVLEKDQIARYSIRIDPVQGFVISKIRRVI
jgi:hypothetical protein